MVRASSATFAGTAGTAAAAAAVAEPQDGAAGGAGAGAGARGGRAAEEEGEATCAAAPSRAQLATPFADVECTMLPDEGPAGDYYLFLDAVTVHLVGCLEEETRACLRAIREGAATREPELGPGVTHIVVGGCDWQQMPAAGLQGLGAGPCRAGASSLGGWCVGGRVGVARPGQARPGQARPGQARPGQASAGSRQVKRLVPVPVTSCSLGHVKQRQPPRSRQPPSRPACRAAVPTPLQALTLP
jgi:hypothetical protein